MALDPNVQRLAKSDNIAVTVTLMPDGQPQALPTWIDTDGDHLLVNTEPQRQKAKNVHRDPRVTVLILNKANPFDFVEVRGHVVDTVGGEQARRHIDKLSQRYTGGPYRMPIGEQGRVILKIASDRQLTAAALFAGGMSLPLGVATRVDRRLRAALVTPLTGPLARYGRAGAAALELWAQQAGVALEIADTWPSTAAAVAATARWPVDVLFGPYGAGPAVAAARATASILWNHGGATVRLARPAFANVVNVPAPALGYLAAVINASRCRRSGR